jgi:hypothetical protein
MNVGESDSVSEKPTFRTCTKKPLIELSMSQLSLSQGLETNPLKT